MITVKVGTSIGAALRTPGAAVETEAGLGLYCSSMQVKQVVGKLFQGIQALGKSGLSSRRLVGNHCDEPCKRI